MYNKNIFKRIFGLLTILLASLTISCEKPGVTYENFEASNVAVYDFWNDGENSNLAFSIDTSNTLHDGSLTFGRILDYLIVYSGTRSAKFVNKDDNSTVNTTSVSLENKKVYSLFLAGTKSSPETILVEDNIAQNPSPDKYNVRVANMITDAGANYTVAIAETGAALATATLLESNVAYKSVTPFKEINEVRGKRYDIYAINPGVDTIRNINVLLVGERSYTINLYGQKGSAYGSNMGLYENVLRY